MTADWKRIRKKEAQRNINVKRLSFRHVGFSPYDKLWKFCTKLVNQKTMILPKKGVQIFIHAKNCLMNISYAGRENGKKRGGNWNTPVKRKNTIQNMDTLPNIWIIFHPIPANNQAIIIIIIITIIPSGKLSQTGQLTR